MMPRTNSLAYSPQNTEPAPVPVIPGNADRTSKRLIGPPEDIRKPLSDLESRTRRRMWTACGAVVLLSSVPFVRAFAPQTHAEAAPPPACTTIAASEIAENVVLVKLDRPAGKEIVSVGNYTGVMDAQPVPGNPTYYRLETAGYLHNDVIGVYIGVTFCNGRFDLGSKKPGDERFFAE